MADTIPSGAPAYCDYIASATPGPCIDARIQNGDWGAGSVPELTLNGAEGQVAWPGQSSDTFDSGFVSIELVVSAGSGSALSAQGTASGSVVDSSVHYGTIQRVEIVASVAGVHRRFTWQSITVRFYKAGVLKQTMTRPSECWPKADTYAVPSFGWRGTRYIPSSADNDSVVVSGQVRLQADAPVIQPWEMQGQILVFAANCVPA